MRAAVEAHGDDHPGGGPVGRAAGAAADAAGNGGDAADRRAWANARLMALPQAAASRANSRIEGLLSEEDEDGRHGG